MFASKIWFFLIALAAAVALAVALVFPRPAQRTLVKEEQRRLAVACGVVDILLADDARNRVELAGSFARTPEIVAALEAASGADKLDEGRMKQVRDVGDGVMKTIQGRKPDFAMLIDRRGRVVARVRLDENDFGDVVSGRPLIDDALAGYLRDDLWAQNGTMYFVTAAPVIRRDTPVAYAGAIVLGHAVTNELAARLVSSLDVNVGFYLGGDDVAGSTTVALDHTAMVDAVKHLAGERALDCQANQPLQLHAGNDDYTAIVARLPGEAAAHLAYYSVFIKRPESLGFSATIHNVKRDDLSFSSFPWLLVGGGFLLALGAGIAFMFFEADRPLRQLTADAVRLAKGESERLSEDAHGGKFGSIARSVNIHIDKLGREAKTARKDLDQLLGPAPEGSLGTIDLLATALPAVRPGGPAPAVAPPPSEFRFQDPAAGMGRPTPPARATTPPPPAARPTGQQPARLNTPPMPMPVTAPPPPLRLQTAPGMAPPPLPLPTPVPATAPAAQPSTPAQTSTPPASLDDDILGGATMEEPPPADPYFKQVFDQFVAVKKNCNEPTTGLTYPKFAEKLMKNRDDLMAKTGCREVKFTVYVKDGKAALKATPVKDE